MPTIKLTGFRGLSPRDGEQVLAPGQGTVATNTDLDSGALRPMVAPQLTKTFPRPGELGFLSPRTRDPSDSNPDVPPATDCVPAVLGAELGLLDAAVVAGEGDTLTFTIAVNEDASPPVIARWYLDDILLPGEIGFTLVLSVTQLQQAYGALVEFDVGETYPVAQHGIVKVVVQNGCGRFESTANAAVVEL